MQIGVPTASSSPGPGAVDVARLLAALRTDPRPRLTWYATGGERVELTGRSLVQWVAKTAHLLAEEADVAPGSLVRVALGPDWRAPVLWLAAWYLGADVVDRPDEGAGGPDGTAADVVVLPEGAELRRGAGAVAVVVAAGALPGPAAVLPAGAVDYGAEVSAQPDDLPAPGPATVLQVPPAEGGRRLVGPGAAPEQLVAVWAAGGSVVLHTGLPADALGRVAAQERTTPTG